MRTLVAVRASQHTMPAELPPARNMSRFVGCGHTAVTHSLCRKLRTACPVAGSVRNASLSMPPDSNMPPEVHLRARASNARRARAYEGAGGDAVTCVGCEGGRT